MEKVKKDKKTRNYTYAVGRRRESVARVRVYDASCKKTTLFGNEYKIGDIVVNGKQVIEYFRFKAYAPIYKRIFSDTDTAGKFIVSAKVEGGGIAAQLEAMVLGIARAFDKIDKEKFHKILRDKGYLTVDARTRQRRMVGMGGKSRRKKQSPKR